VTGMDCPSDHRRSSWQLSAVAAAVVGTSVGAGTG